MTLYPGGQVGRRSHIQRSIVASADIDPRHATTMAWSGESNNLLALKNGFRRERTARWVEVRPSTREISALARDAPLDSAAGSRCGLPRGRPRERPNRVVRKG